jgi:hypothetical protein
LGKPLKNLAELKREGKKDVRPVSAEVFQLEHGVVVVYLFPLSAEISKKRPAIQFEAQIGRIVVAQTFDLSEMEFMGKLELCAVVCANYRGAGHDFEPGRGARG